MNVSTKHRFYFPPPGTTGEYEANRAGVALKINQRTWFGKEKLTQADFFFLHLFITQISVLIYQLIYQSVITQLYFTVDFLSEPTELLSGMSLFNF